MKCWICGGEPHEPRELHVYTTEEEALAWHQTQPQGEPVWPVIDGHPLGGYR